MICYLYTFPNGKRYCGITKNTIQERASGRYKGQRVGYAIQKYGWENITKEILLTSENEDEIKQKEISTIQEFNLLNPEYGYNVSPGGNYQTEEVRRQISQSIKVLWQDDNYREHMTEMATGREVSIETREKISNTLKDRLRDPNFRKERSNKLKEAYSLGHREEAIKKVIEARRQPIAKYAQDGQLLKIFPTAVAAYREFHPDAKSDKAIYRVLNGERKHYQGFIYKRISKIEEEELK